MVPITFSFYFFFFNDTATTEIYTLSLHDALPIYALAETSRRMVVLEEAEREAMELRGELAGAQDRKSTRLNSSHGYISYAVFCLKKKNNHRDCTIRLQIDRNESRRA